MQETGKLKILFVSAEVSPFAKTGGLADVAGSLPQALAAAGNDVRVVMPKYRLIESRMNYVTDFPVQVGDVCEPCIVRETEVSFTSGRENKRITLYFTDSYRYYDRDGIYCYYDDAERFAFFCIAVLEMLPKINFQPDIIHCNDWHTGPVCMLLNEKYRNSTFYSNISTVFTIHNLEYQGNFLKDVLRLFNIGDEIFIPDKVEFYGSFSFLKAGIVYADIINTVSEVYSKEIQTPQYGERLEGLLRKRSQDLFGIVNGISSEEFDPASDRNIYKNYDLDTISCKRENKHALQREMNLPATDLPLIGLISRLTDQKGLSLIVDAMDEFMKLDMQFVLLGTGDDYYENAFRNAVNRYPGKIGTYIGFNAALAQRIYAGSDIFLMPSRFEPCGLGQLISLRYGTIPVVRATGGLAETVTDYGIDAEKGNGFSFAEFSSKDMIKAVERALVIYDEKPDEWIKLVQKAMSTDLSWNKPAAKYMELYRLAIKKNKRGACSEN